MSPTALKEMREKILPFAEKYGMTYLALFGSTARGENGLKSDVDLLVRFSEPVSLIQLITIERKLARKLRKKVDLVTEKSLHPRIKEMVFKDLKTLYEE